MPDSAPHHLSTPSETGAAAGPAPQAWPQTDGSVRIDGSWTSWAGAHGGYVAALALAAMHDRLAGRTGHPVPVRTVGAHFLAPVDQRSLRFEARVLREGRRTSMSAVTALQGGDPVLTGSAVFGRGGSGPAYTDLPAPAVPDPEDCPPLALPPDLALFASHLEIRPATDARPLGAESAQSSWRGYASPTAGRWTPGLWWSSPMPFRRRSSPCGPCRGRCRPPN